MSVVRGTEARAKNVVVKHSEENSYQEAAEKYSINENVASFYFRLASIFYFLHLNCGFCLNLSSIQGSFYLRKYTALEMQPWLDKLWALLFKLS